MITSAQKLLMARAGVRPKEPMVLVFDTTLGGAGTTVSVPLNGTVNVTIDWGDGSSDAYTTTGVKTHTYASNGTYTVEISGLLTAFGFGSVSRATQTKCLSFGNIGLVSLANGFFSCPNLNELPTVLPSTVVSLGNLLVGCSSFNFNINDWDTSNITNMLGCFANCTSFNQPLDNWDTSNVTLMQDMFSNSAFNQNIGGWNVSSVTNMSSMFLSNSSFNQNIGNWDMGAVTNANQMFRSATAFNQDLSGIVTGLSTQPTDFSRSGNVVFRDNANGLKPFLSDGVTQITT